MRTKRTVRQKALNNQRIRRRRRTRIWAMAARIVGSAFIKIAVLFVSLTLLSLIFVYCYHFVLTSPFFALEHLKITGLNAQDQKRVVQLCGIRKGQNLLSIRLNDLREKIESDPWIRSARIERQLPDTLCISAVKQEPWAIVVAEKLYYMNRWGEIFKEVDDGEPVDLPVVTGLADLGSEAGQQLRMVMSFLERLRSEQGPISVKNLSEIHINSSQHFSVYFKGIPAQIQMGPRALGIQLVKLRRLIRHLRSTGRIDEASRIDLEYAGGAVVSFKKG